MGSDAVGGLSCPQGNGLTQRGAGSGSSGSPQPVPAPNKVLTCCQEEREQQQRGLCHPAWSPQCTAQNLGHVPGAPPAPSAHLGETEMGSVLSREPGDGLRGDRAQGDGAGLRVLETTGVSRDPQSRWRTPPHVAPYPRHPLPAVPRWGCCTQAALCLHPDTTRDLCLLLYPSSSMINCN